MNIDEILRQTLAMLFTCHVSGNEAEVFAASIKNIKACVKAIDEARKEKQHDTDDGQGENV